MTRLPFGDPPLSTPLIGLITLLESTDGDRSSIGFLTMTKLSGFDKWQRDSGYEKILPVFLLP